MLLERFWGILRRFMYHLSYFLLKIKNIYFMYILIKSRNTLCHCAQQRCQMLQIFMVYLKFQQKIHKVSCNMYIIVYKSIFEFIYFTVHVFFLQINVAETTYRCHKSTPEPLCKIHAIRKSSVQRVWNVTKHTCVLLFIVTFVAHYKVRWLHYINKHTPNKLHYTI